jgi:cytochrome c biogenesis DsbD-like protein
MKLSLLPPTDARKLLTLALSGLCFATCWYLYASVIRCAGCTVRAAELRYAHFYPQVPSGKDVVSPRAYVSLDPASRGSNAQIAVVMKIRPGFHVNAREKSADYLIATDLKSEIPVGFSAGEVAYPKGKLEKFTFSKDPLNVYQDTVVLKMPLKILPAAPLGAQKIPLKLRYQACSTELCLPPTTLNIEAVVNVVSSESASKPAHPEIFKTK